MEFTHRTYSNAVTNLTAALRPSFSLNHVNMLTIENISLFDFLQIMKSRILATNFSIIDPTPIVEADMPSIKVAGTTGPFEKLCEIHYVLMNFGPLKAAFNGCTLPLLENLHNHGYLTTCPDKILEAATYGLVKWCPITVLHDVAIYVFQPSIKSPPFAKVPSVRYLLSTFKQNLVQLCPSTEDGERILSEFQSRIIENILHRLTGSYKRIGKISPLTIYQNLRTQRFRLSQKSHRILSKALCDQGYEYCLQHFKEYEDVILADLNASSTILIALVATNKLGSLEDVCNKLVAKHGESPIFYSTLTCAFLKVHQYDYAYDILSKFQGSLSEEQSEPICYQLAMLSIMSGRPVSHDMSSTKAKQCISSSQLESFIRFFVDLDTGIPFGFGSNFPFLLAILFRLDPSKAQRALSWLKEQPDETKESIKFAQILMSLPLAFLSLIPTKWKGQFLPLLSSAFPMDQSLEHRPASSSFVNVVFNRKSNLLSSFFKLAEEWCKIDWDQGAALSNAIYFAIMNGHLQSDYGLLLRVLKFLLENFYLKEPTPTCDIDDFDIDDVYQKKISSQLVNSSVMTPLHVHSSLSDILLQACVHSYNFELLMTTLNMFKELRLGFNNHYFALAEILNKLLVTSPNPTSNFGIIANDVSLYQLANTISPDILLASADVGDGNGPTLYDMLETELNIKTTGDIRALFDQDADKIPSSLDAFKEEMARLSLLLALPKELESSPSLPIVLERIRVNPAPLRFLIPLRS